MKVGQLINELEKLPRGYTLEVSKCMALKKGADAAAGYEVVFDFPINGLAINDQDGEVRLVVEATEEDIQRNKHLLGKMIPFARVK